MRRHSVWKKGLLCVNTYINLYTNAYANAHINLYINAYTRIDTDVVQSVLAAHNHGRRFGTHIERYTIRGRRFAFAVSGCIANNAVDASYPPLFQAFAIMFWTPIPILVVTWSLLIRAEYRTPRDVRGVKAWKPLSTALIIVVCGLSLLQPSPDVIYTLLLLAGLALSLIGDVLLIFEENPNTFLVGLVAFLLAHLLYIAAFSHVQATSDALVGGSADLIAAIGLALIAAVVYRWMSPGLGKMRLPVMAYMAVISVMVHRALMVSLVYAGRSTRPNLILAGALLFYLSDAILGINKFRFGGRLPHYKLLNLSTYYVGQLLLALSASLFV